MNEDFSLFNEPGPAEKCIVFSAITRINFQLTIGTLFNNCMIFYIV